MAATLYCDAAGHGYGIARADTLGLAQSSFSVLVWVNIVRHNLNNQGDNAILGSSRGRRFHCLHLIIREGRPHMGFYENDISSLQYLNIGKWYHLAFVYNKEEQRQSIFINGELSASEEGHPSLQGNDEVLLTHYAGDRGLNGKLSQLQIHDHTLSGDEIRLLMFHKSDFLVSKISSGICSDITPVPVKRQLVHDVSVPVFENLSFTKYDKEYVFQDDFSQYYNNLQFSDVIIKIPSIIPTEIETEISDMSFTSFHAHRLILSIRSEYFEMMFAGNFLEANAKEIVLGDLEANVFALFLRSLYSKDIQAVEEILTRENVEDWNVLVVLIEYSQRFQCKDMWKWFELYLVKLVVKNIIGKSQQSKPTTSTEERSIWDKESLTELQLIAVEKELTILLKFFTDLVSFMSDFAGLRSL